jgi:hypothetical protein
MHKREARPRVAERAAERKTSSTLSTTILTVSTFASFASGVSCASVAFACMVVHDTEGSAIFSAFGGVFFFIFGTLLSDLQKETHPPD